MICRVAHRASLMAERRHVEDEAENLSKLDLHRVFRRLRNDHYQSHLLSVPLAQDTPPRRTGHCSPIKACKTQPGPRGEGHGHMRESQDSSPALLPGHYLWRRSSRTDVQLPAVIVSLIPRSGVLVYYTSSQQPRHWSNCVMQPEWLMLDGPTSFYQWVLLRRRRFRS